MSEFSTYCRWWSFKARW